MCPTRILSAAAPCLLAWVPTAGFAQALWSVPDQVQSRWVSFENTAGAKGSGGQANEGRKGAPQRSIRAGETLTLAEIRGPGIIRRIWCTVDAKPEILRGMVLRIYWENQTIPSVEAPLQDFFGIPFARQVQGPFWISRQAVSVSRSKSLGNWP